MGKELGIKRTAKLVGELIKKSNKERVNYLKTLNKNDLNLLSEISMNVIRGNVPITKKTKTILTRVKQTLRKLASKSVKSEVKKKIWFGIKGLYILNILLPIIKNEILLSD